ncbi:hypothetical protein ABZ543_13160 [Streptomyces roseifaciens]
MPFKSRAQEAWAFATKQPWAEEWAQKTLNQSSLPEHVRPQGRQEPQRDPRK